MRNHRHLAFCFVYVACWCHIAFAFDLTNAISSPTDMGESEQPMDFTELPDTGRETLSEEDELFDEDDEEIAFNAESDSQSLSNGHHISKRSNPPPLLYNSPTYCKSLGFCSLMPTLSAICLIKCNFYNISLFQPYLGLLPELPKFMCQSVNTIFPSLPKRIRLSAFRIPNLKAYLKVLNVKQEDVTDFAKTSANALGVTMIKNIRCPFFDHLKPAIKMLEIHDTDKRKPLAGIKKLIGSPFTMNLGQFINQKCDKMNFDDETLLMISAMKTRKCVMDVVMPGYFVFNAAPAVAATRRILPLLRAWNMPLFMFTGVKCCMVKYAISGKRSKCTHKYSILEKPHGLPRKNGPDTVCYAIPEFSPFIPYAKPKLVMRSLGVNQEKGNGTEPVTEETTTTVSPCDDEENREEMEECVTESTSVDYSEEATEAQPDEITTEATEDIQSDENAEY